MKPIFQNNWLTVRNATDAAEVLINGKIGKDWLGDEGLEEKDVRDALAAIPAGKPIRCVVNSPGGNVWSGMAIYDVLNAREGVTCVVSGIAASIAAIICCAGDKTIVPKNALMMIHPAQGLNMGDAKSMRDMADKLEVHNKAIAAVLAEKTGKTESAILDVLAKGETWMTGAEAKAFGLADETTEDPDGDQDVTNAVKNFDLSMFQRVPERLKIKNQTAPLNTGASRKVVMTRDQMIALLKARGVTVANDATDEWLVQQIQNLGAPANGTSTGTTPPANPTPPTTSTGTTQPTADIAGLTQTVQALVAQNENLRRQAVTNEINAMVGQMRITAAEAPMAITRAMRDDSYMAELRLRPQQIPGAEPTNSGLVCVADDVRNVMNALGKQTSASLSIDAKVVTASARSTEFAAIWKKEGDRIRPVLNTVTTNTIDSALKRAAILNDTVRAFATRLAPLRLFCTSFMNVPLQGLDTVVVPYFPLQTTASSDWSETNGYIFDSTTNSNSKTITVNKRKYQPIDYTSQVFRRQPYYNVQMLGAINAEKLGVDVLTDVLSVITTATYGAAVRSLVPSAATSDDIVDVRNACNAASWPDAGRGLIVDSTLDTGLMKDPSLKLALNIGGTEVIRQGKMPNIFGFNYAWMPNLPTNSENLVGFAAFASGILAAFCPVEPTPEVRAQLSAYEIATDAESGVSMNYRAWGLAQADRSYEVIESAYGYVAGEVQAIKRIEKTV